MRIATALSQVLRSIALTGLLLVVALAEAATGMRPGLWELTITMEIAGQQQSVPAGRACIAQSDIDDPTRTLPRPEGGCTLSNVQRSPEQATYDLVCTQNAVTTRGKARITFTGDRYDGTVDMMITGKSAMPLSSQMTLAAVRVDDCSK